jgi:predicted unusual protein kinase regulating ubiquinone biosynthesis (AarF/ABC1/UbiB family)
MKIAIKDAVIGVAHRDAQQILSALRDLRFLRPGADSRGVKNAIDWLLNNYTGLQASNLTFEDVGEIQTDIEQILHDQPVTLPAHLAFLGKTLSMTIGVATGLDPHIDLIESTRPYVSRLTREQDWQSIALKEAKTIGMQLLGIPKQLHETLEAAASGRLQIKIDSQDIVDAIDRSHGHRSYWSAALFSGLVLLGGIWLIEQDMTAIGYVFITLGFVSFLAGNSR